MADRIAVALTRLQVETLYPRPQDLVFAHPDTGRPLDRSKLIRRFKGGLRARGGNTALVETLLEVNCEILVRSVVRRSADRRQPSTSGSVVDGAMLPLPWTEGLRGHPPSMLGRLP